MRRNGNMNSSIRNTWFFQRFLNNKAVTSLLIILLSLLIIKLFTQIAYLFSPISQFFNFIAFPIIATIILFYLVSPIINKLDQRGINKRVSIFGLFIVIVLLIVWGVSYLVPILQNQTKTFMDNLPGYMETIDRMITESPFIPNAEAVFPNISSYIENFDLAVITEQINPILTSTFGSLGSVIGTITQLATGFVMIPILLYYILVEGDKISQQILHHIPTKYRPTTRRIMYRGNYQVSQYIRGQILVALIVGIMFGVGYAIIGLDYGVTLAVISGLLNVIPYLGSFIAVVPALIIGLLTSPLMFVKVILVLVIEQTIEGRIVSPQILGNSMKIHPVTILLILVGAGHIFGLMGVILGVPGYAVIKVIISELYGVFREQSGLYDEDEAPIPLIIEENEGTAENSDD
ncbi:AI-2E family transporter [Fundicoccus sp. Sow4_D5]|uniref:AI-2E family transporter n=1 Tax=unclassified Fundicoccus TaxID=2761543 RepID=UPI003F8E8E70